MRVLHFLHYAQGGIVTVVFELIRHSQDSSIEHQVVFVERTAALDNLAREMGISVHYVGGSFASTLAGWRRLLVTLEPAVIHAHSYVPRVVVGVSARLGWWNGLSVSTFHNDYPHFREPGLKARLKRYTEHLALRAVRGPVVACSEPVRKAVERTYHLPKDRLRTIHNGIATPEGRSTALETAPPIAVTVGRVSAQKNYLGLLESWREVARQLPAAQLWIIGDGDERPVLEERIGSYGLRGSVKLFGWIPRQEVAERIRQAQLFVMCSRYEGLPTAAIEAQMLGVPVLTTRVAGIEDIVAHDVTGQILPDQTALAPALVRLLSDLPCCRRWGAQARSLATQRFGVDRYVAEIEALYRADHHAPSAGIRA